MERPLTGRHRPNAASIEFPGLYVIFDIPQPALSAAEITRLGADLDQLLQAGARLVQLRAKHLREADFLDVAQALVPRANASGARMLINTSAGICRQTGAGGVHRPAQGEDVAALRQAAARKDRDRAEILIGVSCHSLHEVLTAQEEGADFVTLSPIFPTSSKPGYGPALGVDNLQRICTAAQIPVFALAGVTSARAAECLRAGAAGVAVMGGILHAPSPAAATQRYLKALEHNKI